MLTLYMLKFCIKYTIPFWILFIEGAIIFVFCVIRICVLLTKLH